MSRRKHDRHVRDLIEDRYHQAYGLAWGCGLVGLVFIGLILALSSF